MRNKPKQKRDYYAEIDTALQSYEDCKSLHDKSMDWICNRIDWCWKFKHITEEQMEELAERACKILNREY